METKKIVLPIPQLQIGFFRKLDEMRDKYLVEGLQDTLRRVNIIEVDSELHRYAEAKSLSLVASWGLRGEFVFAVPYLLQLNPYLLGYYRLLLGYSQKQFYARELNLQKYRLMEEKGIVQKTLLEGLPALCLSLCSSAADLIRGTQRISETNIRELIALTLGPQLRGGVLNILGSEATKTLHRELEEIVSGGIVHSSGNIIEVENAAGRTVSIEFGNDPDIRISEFLPSGKTRNLVAIEIKGGMDRSNIHNRLGEAEKSHQKARKEAFTECWTIVRVRDLDLALAKKESPSTDRFYNLDELSKEGSSERSSFREHILSIVGLKD